MLSSENRVQSRTPLTRTGVTVGGIIGGVIGMEHGFFETLQGSVPTDGVVINAIGPAQRFWEGGTESALTLIPNFLVSGICAMLVGLVMVIWSARFVHRRFGALGYFLLQVLLLLVGGGIAFSFVAVVICITATRTGKPLAWWRARVPVGARRALARLWPWLFWPASAIFCLLIFGGIFGIWFLDSASTTRVLMLFGFISLGLMTAAFVAGVAGDSAAE